MTLDLQISFNITAFPLIKGTMWINYKSDLSKGRENVFSYNSAMILTFDLENMSNVTTYLLFISSVHVKYKPKTAKWILWMLWKKKSFAWLYTI